MITELIKAEKEKKKGKSVDEIYSSGYYMLGGVISGFLLVELWNKLNLPGFDQPVDHAILTNKPIDNANKITVDKLVVTLLSGGLVIADVFGLKGGAPSGAGIMLGYTYNTAFRKQKYIGTI